MVEVSQSRMNRKSTPESMAFSAALLLLSIPLLVSGKSQPPDGGKNTVIEPGPKAQEKLLNDVEPTVFDAITNSSFGFSLPLFSITVPGYGREHPEIDQFRSVNFGNLALLGMVTLGTLSVSYPLIATRVNQFTEVLGAAQRLKRDLESNSNIDLLKIMDTAAAFLVEDPEDSSSTHSRQKRSSAGPSYRGASRTLNLNRGLATFSEYIMKRVDKSLERFPNIPSLDPQECMKRSVCEAHNQPDKYGLIGLMLQVLFPPYLNGEAADTEDPLGNSVPDDISPSVSKYQQAARYGRRNDAECGRQYDGCIVSLLEVSQKIINYFMK